MHEIRAHKHRSPNIANNLLSGFVDMYVCKFFTALACCCQQVCKESLTCMFEMSLQCVMLSMSQQGHPHNVHHVFVDMYVWNVHSVLVVVSKSAQKAKHSAQLHLKPCMFDISLQCSIAKNLLLTASLPRFPRIDYKFFCHHAYLEFPCSACCCQRVCKDIQK